MEEAEGWVFPRLEEEGVDGHEEGEGEKGDNDEVDQADGYRGDGDGWVEGAEVVDAECYAGRKGLWGGGVDGWGEGGVGEDELGPGAAEGVCGFEG